MFEIKVNGKVVSKPQSEQEAYSEFSNWSQQKENKLVEMIKISFDEKGYKNRETIHKFSR